MAYLSDYTAGTVTVAANSTTVTGSGTAWQTASFREGDWFIANGWVNVVASVNSNTSVTLAMPWRGGALSGSAYRMRYMSDGSRASAQARQLIDLLGGSGSLEALAGLTGGPNQLPFFTGAGTMGTTDLTPFARTLLDDASAATARSTLELGSAALENTGQFGWGANNGNVALPGDNADTLTVNGVWRTISSTVGTPESLGQLIHIGQSANLAFQIFIGTTTQSILTRYRNTSGVWTAWRTYGVERGSNANGDFIRFGDGTQICHRLNFSNTAITISTGSFFTSGDASWLYPAAFISTPSVFWSTRRTSAGTSTPWISGGIATDSNTTAFARLLAGFSNVQGDYSAFAVGRYK